MPVAEDRPQLPGDAAHRSIPSDQILFDAKGLEPAVNHFRGRGIPVAVGQERAVLERRIPVICRALL